MSRKFKVGDEVIRSAQSPSNPKMMKKGERGIIIKILSDNASNEQLLRVCYPNHPNGTPTRYLMNEKVKGGISYGGWKTYSSHLRLAETTKAPLEGFSIGDRVQLQEGYKAPSTEYPTGGDEGIITELREACMLVIFPSHKFQTYDCWLRSYNPDSLPLLSTPVGWAFPSENLAHIAEETTKSNYIFRDGFNTNEDNWKGGLGLL